MDGFSLSVASYVVKGKAGKFNRRKMCMSQGKIRPFPQKRPDFVELLGGFEPPTSSLPTARLNFLQYFRFIYSCFCSNANHFQHFLMTGSPLFPALSVAGYVVKTELLHAHRRKISRIFLR
ncbi:MAG: hypothetical protein HDT14_06610 [Oscillibacter sp.]|nr:hypothetical protein [Oscillibacter sp.]